MEDALHCSQIIQDKESVVAEDTSQPDRNVGVMERDSNGHVTHGHCHVILSKFHSCHVNCYCSVSGRTKCYPKQKNSRSTACLGDMQRRESDIGDIQRSLLLQTLWQKVWIHSGTAIRP